MPVGDFGALDKAIGGPYGRGNINLNDRNIYKWPDDTGGYSSLESMTVGFGNKHVLIPKINDAGKLMTDEQAIQHHIKTGQHLGEFDNPSEAQKYAIDLERRQQAYYERGPGRQILDYTFRPPEGLE